MIPCDERGGALSDLTQRERSRTRALGLLRDISHDPRVSETDRLEAATVLFKSDRELREPALRSLREIAVLLDPLGARVNGFAPLCGDFRF
ncbi:hypothetical protein NOGI109294_13250 [Nocardiopsis gilva]